MQSVIKVDDHEIRIITENQIIYYCAKDICNILKLKNNRDVVTKINNNDKKLIIINDSINRKQTTTFLTEIGLKHILFSSRSLYCDTVAHLCNISMNTKFECKEASTIKLILKIFKGEQMKLQYAVNQYRLDLYFLEYNLAIECDEYNHNDRNQENEKIRENVITDLLHCEFIRYDPDDKDFDIYQVINQIFRHIKLSLKKRAQ
jgi:very-short-patch-repair endonuclease